MPRLLLFRHAKAERARPGEKDHERRLAPRGEEDSAEMGRVMAERGETPDLVLCSSSARTRETWERARAAFGASPDVRFLRSIYAAEADYLPILREEGGDAASVVLVGHNPAIHATALRLAKALAGPDGAALAQQFPTAGIAVFESDIAWERLKPGAMKLVAFLRPSSGEGD
jgi:phosphohistidine phosphatase